MKTNLGVLVIDGLDNRADNFPDETIEALKKLLLPRGIQGDDIVWEPVCWDSVLDADEEELWQDVAGEDKPRWVKLRKLLLAVDAGTHRYLKDCYQMMYEALYDSIVWLESDLRGEKPLVIVAHSLGAMVVSHYIWDRQMRREQDRYGKTPFQRMETLCGLVTLGAITPFFALSPEVMSSIQFPPAQLPEYLKSHAAWFNLYEVDDVPGWLFTTPASTGGEVPPRHRKTKVENILDCRNIFTHAAPRGWGDRFFPPVANFLAGMLGQVK